MQNEKLTLDVFRQNDLGYSLCHINYDVGSVLLPFVYNDYFSETVSAFTGTLTRLENCEFCPTAYNVQNLQIFTNLFCCLEQFISLLYECLYFYKETKQIPKEKEAITLFRQDYNKTIDKIFEIIETPKIDYNRTALPNKIKELEDARNYIVHGNIGKIRVKKTRLTNNPLTINQEDIMEELDIIINFINYFRYILPNIDLMPNIPLFIGSAVHNKKLDEYFYKVLCPYFYNILDKHNLQPKGMFHLNTKSIKSETSIIAKRISISTKVQPDKTFDKIKMNSSKTNMYIINLRNIISDEEHESLKDKIQLPKFMLDKEDK